MPTQLNVRVRSPSENFLKDALGAKITITLAGAYTTAFTTYHTSDVRNKKEMLIYTNRARSVQDFSGF